MLWRKEIFARLACERNTEQRKVHSNRTFCLNLILVFVTVFIPPFYCFFCGLARNIPNQFFLSFLPFLLTMFILSLWYKLRRNMNVYAGRCRRIHFYILALQQAVAKTVHSPEFDSSQFLTRYSGNWFQLTPICVHEVLKYPKGTSQLFYTSPHASSCEWIILTRLYTDIDRYNLYMDIIHR